MKLNFAAPILDLQGKPLKEDETKDATLGSILCTALLANYPDEQNLSGEEKVKRFRLAEAAVSAAEQEVKLEDIVLLKKLVAKAFGPLIVGRVYDIIEPPLKFKKPE